MSSSHSESSATNTVFVMLANSFDVRLRKKHTGCRAENLRLSCRIVWDLSIVLRVLGVAIEDGTFDL